MEEMEDSFEQVMIRVENSDTNECDGCKGWCILMGMRGNELQMKETRGEVV